MLTSRAMSPVFVFERNSQPYRVDMRMLQVRHENVNSRRPPQRFGVPDELTLPYAAARQLCCFPVHRHANSRAATGMIEKDEFLQRGRLHFTIFPEFHRGHR